jgi:RimJ/RimL family protein N-acetyltransferase
MPASADDLDYLCELFWHPEVRRFLCAGDTLPRDVIKGMLERAARSEAGGVGLWIMKTRLEGYVGYCGIEEFKTARGISQTIRSGVHLQIALHPRAWGRGLATQAIELLVDHALGRCGLERIYAGVFESNERAHRLMPRCRFSEVERLSGPKLIMYERRSL